MAESKASTSLTISSRPSKLLSNSACFSSLCSVRNVILELASDTTFFAFRALASIISRPRTLLRSLATWPDVLPMRKYPSP